VCIWILSEKTKYKVMETKLYRINVMAAKSKGIPAIFAAVSLKETNKAVYLYGSGTKESAKTGVCMICGRTLTHPVSVELGIGPECGHHYWDWNLVGGYSKENIERLTQVIREKMVVDTWLPKSWIRWSKPAEETEIITPANHPMLQEIKKPGKLASLVTTSSGKSLIKIEFPYNRDDLDIVRGLPERKYHSDRKCWSCPLNLDAVKRLKECGWILDTGLEKYLNRVNVNVKDMDNISIPGLQGTLFPFQQKGVAFIEARQGNALIADEMGLGKTVQALAWLQLHPELRPVVIVVPASLKLNWKREAERWMSKPDVQVLSGTDSSQPIVAKILIINYDVLDSWVDKLKVFSPKVMITDECHYYKNNQAKRTKAVKKLGKAVDHVIALSGTPIVNRPVEAYNALKLIDETVVPNFWTYAQKYCGARHNGYGWDFSGATNTEELHEKLVNTIMIRRKKSEVLKDLPEKLRAFVPMELNNRDTYRNAEVDFINFVRQYKGQAAANRASNAQALAEIEGLKQLAVKGKMNQAIDWIENFLEVDGKLVVFAIHKFVIDMLMERFGNVAVKIDGSVSGVNRDQAVQRFQTDDATRLFVGNIRAAGVGLTLTAANNVVFLELPWTPGELTQAEDRCHRIGQQGNVTINFLLAENTIEEKIARLIDNKQRVLDSVLDGKETEEESLLSELINQYE
jgi:SNF2 family DNA or RNA helicase